MRLSMMGRPMTEAYLDREVGSEEYAWAVRKTHRRLYQLGIEYGIGRTFVPLAELVTRPGGRARKPEVKPGLARPDHVGGVVPAAWLAIPPDAAPSYDPDQEARAKALVTQELREMDGTW